jgi:hypothetical protein
LPDAAQADERSPRTWYGTYLVYLIEYRPSLDEVSVATEGYDGQRVWWSLWSFWAIVSADQLGPFATYLEGYGDGIRH